MTSEMSKDQSRLLTLATLVAARQGLRDGTFGVSCGLPLVQPACNMVRWILAPQCHFGDQWRPDHCNGAFSSDDGSDVAWWTLAPRMPQSFPMMRRVAVMFPIRSDGF